MRIVMRMLSDPPLWLRLLTLVVVFAAFVERLAAAHSVGDWLWVAAMAAAVLILGASLVAARQR